MTVGIQNSVSVDCGKVLLHPTLENADSPWVCPKEKAEFLDKKFKGQFTPYLPEGWDLDEIKKRPSFYLNKELLLVVKVRVKVKVVTVQKV